MTKCQTKVNTNVECAFEVQELIITSALYIDINYIYKQSGGIPFSCVPTEKSTVYVYIYIYIYKFVVELSML